MRGVVTALLMSVVALGFLWLLMLWVAPGTGEAVGRGKLTALLVLVCGSLLPLCWWLDPETTRWLSMAVALGLFLELSYLRFRS